MRIEFSVAAQDGSTRDFVAHADPETPVWEIVDLVIPDDRHPTIYRGCDPLPREVTVAADALRSGDVVSSRPGRAVLEVGLTSQVILVVGGADAGRVHVVQPGRRYDIGRATSPALLVDDPTTSRAHATITLRVDGVLEVVDVGSTSGTWINGQRIAPNIPAQVRPGEQFIFGQAVLELLLQLPDRGSVELSEEGVRSFNRVGRHVEPEPETLHDKYPMPPSAAGRVGTTAQLLTGGVMVFAGITTAVIFGNIVLAIVGVLAPLAMFSTTVANGRAARREQRKQQQVYERDLARVKRRIAEAVERERRHGASLTLDPARCVLAAAGPSTALWARSPLDREGLLLRLGTRDRPPRIDLGQDVDEGLVPSLVAAPVTVDLQMSPVVGIAGPSEFAYGSARAVVHQLALTYGPDELAIYHLGDDGGAEWDWLRWLPHTRVVFPDVHTVSPTAGALASRLDELMSQLRLRQELMTDGFLRGGILLPLIVVILDNAKRLRSQSVITLMKAGGDVGIYVLAVDTDARDLPREARTKFVTEVTERGSYLATLSADNATVIDRITPDLVSGDRAAGSARAVASLTPLGGAEGGGMPDSVRLSDLLEVDLTDADAVARSWRMSEPAVAVLGVDETGSTRSVNLVEHGPHALVAGTSGAGKSEFVRTLLTGLALSSPPTDLALFLIDFKGGGAFGKLRDLPHVVGYADNLSIGGHLAFRLLDSLKAELKTRQALFQRAENSDGISEYNSVRRRLPELPQVQRLVIAVDEFAQLKQEQPDFIDGLVEVARIGRSLGVHLILATQEPAGVITDQIRTNVKLRICLRTLDTATSRNVVGTPVAGSFPNAAVGRAAVLAGDRVLTVQTGYVSAPARGRATTERPAPAVRELPWDACGLHPKEPKRSEGDRAGATDLTRFVDAARAAAIGMPPSPIPWLEPLPTAMSTTDERLVGAALPSRAIAYGVEDFPHQQAQLPATFILGTGNLGIAGGRASGRSTALTTIAAALATRFSPDDVHLHVVDYMPTAPLARLEDLPHCGTFAGRRDAHKAARLVQRLSDELDRRADLLAQRRLATFADLVAADGQVMPWIVVLVDGWESINAAGGQTDAVKAGLLRLANDGPALGLQVILGGGTALANQRVQQLLSELICLGFKDLTDMRTVGVRTSHLPSDIPPGQAYRPGGDTVVQIAHIGEDPSLDSQAAALARIAATAPKPLRRYPIEIKPLPSEVSLAEVRSGSADARRVVVGIGGDDAAALTVDFTQFGPPFGVLGGRGTGRTSALALIARQLHDAGVPIAVLATNPASADLFAGLKVGSYHEEVEFFHRVRVVLLDDTDSLPDNEPFIVQALQIAGLRLVVAADPAVLGRGAGWRMRLGARSGVLLSPAKSSDAACLDAKIDLVTAPPSTIRGRGYLVEPGSQPQLIQVPLP